MSARYRRDDIENCSRCGYLPIREQALSDSELELEIRHGYYSNRTGEMSLAPKTFDPIAVKAIYRCDCQPSSVVKGKLIWLCGEKHEMGRGGGWEGWQTPIKIPVDFVSDDWPKARQAGRDFPHQFTRLLNLSRALSTSSLHPSIHHFTRSQFLNFSASVPVFHPALRLLSIFPIRIFLDSKSTDQTMDSLMLRDEAARERVRQAEEFLDPRS